MKLPSHRYIRLRNLQGITGERLLYECVSILDLPGLSNPAKTVSEILDSAPKAPNPKALHLHVAVDNTKQKKKPAGKAKKEADETVELPWLDSRHDSELDKDDYAKRYGLTRFLSAPGEKLLKSATRLWMNATTRDLVQGHLLCNTPVKEIALDVAKVTTLKNVSEADIEAFQSLFWDFSLMGSEERLAFLRTNRNCMFAYTAASHGLQSMLYRLGIGAVDISRVDMLKSIASSTFLRLDEERVSPGSVCASDLVRLTTTLYETWKVLDENDHSQGDDLRSELLATSIRVRDAAPIPGYAELLEESDKLQQLEYLRMAERDGVITDVRATELRALIESGEDVGTEVRGLIKSLDTAPEIDEDAGGLDVFGPPPSDGVDPFEHEIFDSRETG